MGRRRRTLMMTSMFGNERRSSRKRHNGRQQQGQGKHVLFVARSRRLVFPLTTSLFEPRGTDQGGAEVRTVIRKQRHLFFFWCRKAWQHPSSRFFQLRWHAHTSHAGSCPSYALVRPRSADERVTSFRLPSTGLPSPQTLVRGRAEF